MKKNKLTTLIDPTVSQSDMHAYGYMCDSMIPLKKERALEIFDHNEHEIYLLYEDDTESAVCRRDEILAFGGLFGVIAPKQGCELCEAEEFYIIYLLTPLCKRCYDLHYEYCDHCLENCWRSSAVSCNRGDLYLCKPCYIKHYSKCDTCGIIKPKEEIVAGSRRRYCENCPKD